MISRPLRMGDQEAIARIHAKMGMDYKMPELAGEGVDFVQVIEDGGRVVGGSMNRIVAETYLWVDPDLPPEDKMLLMRMATARTLAWAAANGVRELIACIPEVIEKKFKKRLNQLQWNRLRDGWTIWGRNVPRNGAS